MLGPAIGGFLAFPAEHFPKTFHKISIVARYVILLPNMVVAAVLMFCLLTTYFRFPSYPNYSLISSKEEEALSIEEPKNKPGDGKRRLNETLKPENNRKGPMHSSLILSLKKSNLIKVVGTKENIMTSILFGYAGFINIGFKDVFTLYAATARSYKGYGMGPNEIGFTVFIVTCMEPILTIILIPKIKKLIGLEKPFTFVS